VEHMAKKLSKMIVDAKRGLIELSVVLGRSFLTHLFATRLLPTCKTNATHSSQTLFTLFTPTYEQHKP